MSKIRTILEDFKNKIVAITHKDIPKYDWQEAGYSNAKNQAEEAIKNTRLTEKEIDNLLYGLLWKNTLAGMEGKLNLEVHETRRIIAHALYEAQTRKLE